MTRVAWPRPIQSFLRIWNGCVTNACPSAFQPLAGDRNMTRNFFAISLLFVLCGRAAAGLPPEATRPYRLQVVLHIAQHPWITDVFQTQVQRELRDSLQAALGDLARVEVLRDHPRLQEVKQKGL